MRLRRFLLIVALFKCALSTPTTEQIEIYTAEYVTETANVVDDLLLETATLSAQKTITQLVNEQTEAIKKILAEHKPPAPPPSVNLTKTNDHEIVEESNVEQESLEMQELKKKCQQLSRIFDHHERPHTQTQTKPQNQLSDVRPPQMAGNYFIFTQNPNMYGPRIDKYSGIDNVAAASTNEETLVENEDVVEEQEVEVPTTSLPEITTISTTTTTTKQELANSNLKFKMKYVRLEPLILQKSLSSTGKTAYYWYRILPTTQSFVQIPDIPENDKVQAVAQPQNLNGLAADQRLTLPEQYEYFMHPQSGQIIRNMPTFTTLPTTTTSTSTTTEQPVSVPVPVPESRPQFFINPQTGMIYQAALPHQLIYHKRYKPNLRNPTATALTTPTTVTTPTTELPPTTTEPAPEEAIPTYSVDIDIPQTLTQTGDADKQPVNSNSEIQKKFKHEFRFVIPMVVTGEQEHVANYPYKMDPYAYMTKDKRPSMMNLPVPYVPNYHMIRTLSVPNIQH